MHKQILAALCLLALPTSACAGLRPANPDTSLVIYSGRGEELVGPLLERFSETTGIAVQVRYAGSTELAATLLEEGGNSPADAFFAQDPASLGAVAQAGLLSRLPDDVLSQVPARFRDGEGQWVGVSGRVRTLVYDTRAVSPETLPQDVWDLTDPAWRGRIGIAPGNGSFLAFVAAMILTEGEDRTRDWLTAIAANRPVSYEGNGPIVAAVDAGEIELGLVNHYYLLRLRAEQGRSNAANHFLPAGDAGSLVMPAGVGVLATSPHPTAARSFVEFLLSAEAQSFFAQETFEYPLVGGIPAGPDLPALDGLATPPLDLSDLADTIDRATDLVAEAGLL